MDPLPPARSKEKNTVGSGNDTNTIQLTVIDLLFQSLEIFLNLLLLASVNVMSWFWNLLLGQL